jgi:hypothetical protein
MTGVGKHELRYEVKFTTHAIHRDKLQRWLLDHAAGFTAPYLPRRVNNVYFDTWDLRAYAENLAGVSQRTKIRYRWYGDEEGPAPGTLEAKHRRNRLGWKERFGVGMRVWTPGWSWQDVRYSLIEQIPRAARTWLDANPQPVFINRYNREYFVSGDGLVRATIDTGQCAFDQRFGTMPNLRNAAALQDTVVLEFKFAPQQRALASTMLSSIPVRLGRHSKYMNAVRAIAMV